MKISDFSFIKNGTIFCIVSLINIPMGNHAVFLIHKQYRSQCVSRFE